MGRIIYRIFSFFRSDSRQTSHLLNETFVLTGADLYRLNCQSCHGPDGTGSPPEIKSLLDPVRGTSPTLIRQRMAEKGREIDEEFARELAANAEATLRQRLEEGGERMPSFEHLRGDEVEALLEYLKELAGVPEAGRKEILVTQSVARVGEHLVKANCHICHDATGPGGGHMAMMRGIIPSLASFPQQLSAQQVIRQVKMGSSRMMSMMGGDRMPAFPYLTEEEIAAAYLYLAEYPPRP
jgi:mono/diheme cytochrome c family protein